MPSTADIWALQHQHPGDREALFTSVERFTAARCALYAGSFVDVTASVAFPDVTYVDLDRRAARFFDDRDGVRTILDELGAPLEAAHRFVHGSYEDELPIADASCDILISSFAGPVSAVCARYLRVGGYLLANPSHGDVALASIDPRFRLAAAVHSRPGGYRIDAGELDTYLVPRRPIELTPESVRALGRGVAYTRSAFAYLFERVEPSP